MVAHYSSLTNVKQCNAGTLASMHRRNYAISLHVEELILVSKKGMGVCAKCGVVPSDKEPPVA